MKAFASKRYQRVSNFALAAMLVVSTLAASVPFIFSHSANALSTVVTASANQGWSSAAPYADTRVGSAVTYVPDSTVGTTGNGAIKITTDSTTTTKAQFMKAGNLMALSSVTGSLGYSTKQNSAPFAGADPSYQIQLFLNQDGAGTNSGYATLGYEPYVNFGNAAIHNGEWQNWSMSDNTGLFYSSKTINGVGGGVVTSQGSSTYTLSQIKSYFPNATVIAFGLNVGSNNPSYDVEADNFTFNGTTYDFEVTPPATPANLRLNGNIVCGYATNVNFITPTWDAVEGAVSYNYRVTLNGNQILGFNPVYNVGNVTSVNGPFGGEGLSTFSVQAVGADGATSAWATACNVSYDATAPAGLANVSPADGTVSTTADQAVITWTDVTDANGPISYYYESSHSSAINLDGSFVTPVYQSGALSDNQIPTPGTPEGIYYWHVRAVDAANNSTPWTNAWIITIDNTAPTATIIFPGYGPTATGFSVQFSEAVKQSEAENLANYFLDNWPGAGGSGDLVGDATVGYNTTTHLATITFTNPAWYISPEQKWGVENIHDLAGTLVTPNPTTAYSSPLVAPTSPGTPVTITPTTSNNVNWTWTAATDPGAEQASGVKGYEYSLVTAGDSPTSWTFTNATSATTVTVADGAYDLYVRAIDNAGNTGTASVGHVIVDTTGPNVAVDANTFATNQPTITGTVDSDAVTVNVVVSSEDGSVIIESGPATYTAGDTTWSYSVTTPLANGNYLITARAYDALNNFKDNAALIGVSVTPEAPQGGGQTTTTTTTVTPIVTPTITSPTVAAVLGATTDNATDNKGDADVKGTSTLDSPAAIDTNTSGNIFGIAWYWWLLILLALAGIIWGIIGGIRRRNEDA